MQQALDAVAAIGEDAAVDDNVRSIMNVTTSRARDSHPTGTLDDRRPAVGLDRDQLLDRQVLSVLASELRTQFQWSNAQYGYIAVSSTSA